MLSPANNTAGYSPTPNIVVFGTAGTFTAAVMMGPAPAIEGGAGVTPEVALRKLLLTTAEVLDMYMPKVGAHSRNVHGGGIFDVDLLRQDVVEANIKG